MGGQGGNLGMSGGGGRGLGAHAWAKDKKNTSLTRTGKGPM